MIAEHLTPGLAGEWVVITQNDTNVIFKSNFDGDQVTIDWSQIAELDGPAPLYKRFARQAEPQRAYVKLHVSGVVTASYDPEIGGAVPIDVYSGLTRRYIVPNNLTANGIRALLRDNWHLIVRIILGMTVRWSGTCTIGRLSYDAAEAEQELDHALNPDNVSWSEYENVEVWDAGEWVDYLGKHGWRPSDEGLSADLTARELALAADRMHADALSYGIYISGWLSTALRAAINDMAS